jgi:hypothetical protein
MVDCIRRANKQIASTYNELEIFHHNGLDSGAPNWPGSTGAAPGWCVAIRQDDTK